MSRYSPRVSHNGGRVVADGMDRLTNALAYSQDRERLQRLDAQDQTDRELGRAFDETRLYNEGVRTGRAPKKESRLFSGGETLGQFDAPRTGGRSPFAMALEQTPRPPRQEPEPELVALPGALIPGEGFTDRALFRNPRLGMQQAAEDPVMVSDPRYPQITDDRYLDTQATPDARAARAYRSEMAAGIEADAAARRQQLEDEARERSYEVEDAQTEYDREQELIRLRAQEDRRTAQVRDQSAAEPTIRMDGRTFPDTPEGRAEAIAWESRNAGPSESEPDPAVQERRKSIVDLAGRGPGTEAEQIAVDLLAAGDYRSPDEIAQRMREINADAQDQGQGLPFSEDEIEGVLSYLRPLARVFR